MRNTRDLPREPGFVDQPVSGITNTTVARRNLRIIEICRHFRAEAIYVGARAADYICADLFDRCGIGVPFQDYKHPVYPQQKAEFRTHMSVIDLMMNAYPCALDLLLSSPPPIFNIERHREHIF